MNFSFNIHCCKNIHSMSRLSIPIPQDECLYDARWTKETDNLFVDLLIESHVLGQWKNGPPGSVVLDYCRYVLFGELELRFRNDELNERFHFLEKRYNVFSWMLRKPSLRHCVQSNILTAPVAVWDDVFESNPFSVAYQHSGDPRWEDLRFMFEEVYSLNPTSEVVHDRNSTNEGFMAPLGGRTNVVSDNSYHNALQSLCSGNNFAPGPHDASSESSVNTHAAHVIISRVGSRTPLRIPRPPHKPEPASCKGSCSDPHV
ncbi:ribonuclease 3 [Striga asiatica]|uniref:Ribonuclease 3 n=1 Tax=Striga asiatica TaxID=4170 RepID=A0A5A7PXI9_STRAF|nr:ribonuclease 3 [Striga asiatica]